MQEQLYEGQVPKLLLVDDILENLQVLRGRLRLKGYELHEASSGQEALNFMETAWNVGTSIPDLLLLDVQMPDMDGFEVCRKLKADSRFREIPIIFITARGEMEDIVEGFTLGAVDYVIKPFNAAELLTRVKTHLDLKFSRDALQRNNALLEKLNREKTEFMSIAAHDLKNPLATVKWLTNLLQTGTLPPDKSAETLEKINLAADRMFRLVKNLLDVNAIEEAGLFSQNALEPSNHAAAELTNAVLIAAEVLGNYEELSLKKRITAQFSNQARNAAVNIHSEILTQILDNLISNALKYTPEGGTFLVKISNIASNLVITVEDTGVGIAENERKKLFTKFGTTSSRPTGGEDSTGLGLFIVKKLAEAAGGNVRYEPASNQGSRFILSVPNAPTMELQASLEEEA